MALKIRKIETLGELKKTWRSLASDQSLYSHWKFRELYYAFFQRPICSLIALDKDEPVALLPLQFNPEEKVYEFFGDDGLDSMEDNRVFYKPGYEDAIPMLFNASEVSNPLNYIVGDDPFTQGLPVTANKYVVPLEDIHSLDDYFRIFLPAKTRNTARRLVKKFDTLGASVRLNHALDLPYLYKFNIQVFGEDSYFVMPHRQELFDTLFLEMDERQLVTILINDSVVAVSFSLMYNGVFYFCYPGANSQDFPGIGNYLTLKSLERAIELGAHQFDAAGGSKDWKERYHFTKVAMRSYIPSELPKN